MENTEKTTGISVIICAYTEERWSELVGAIKSVQRQDLRPQEIVVVIDHNEPLLTRVQKQFPGIIVIPNREKKGLSGARNTGIAWSAGALIAFLDDDAVADSTWLSLIKPHFRDTLILGVGGAIEPLWASKPAWFPVEFQWVVGCTYRGMPETVAPVRNLIGANMCIRREVFETVGGFRSEIGRVGTLPMGCEETELCIRAHQRWPQRKFLYDPRARVQHHVPAHRSTWAYFVSRCLAEGQSKALVSRLVGAADGLASERRYTLHVLPIGVLNSVRDALLRRKPEALAKPAAIVGGLLATAWGYVVGRARRRRPARISLAPVMREY